MTVRAPDEATRCVVVEWPDWSTVAAGAVPGSASAVLHANRVVAVTPAARVEGVVPGMRRREAQRLCPGLVVLPHDLERDARRFEPVLQALENVSPLIEVAAPGCCTFVARGPSRYYGGDPSLVDHVIDVVAAALGSDALGIVGPPTVGLADGAFAALLAARFARSSVADPSATGVVGQREHFGAKAGRLVIPAGASAVFLASFPVGVLLGHDGIDERFLGLLPQLGIRTLGQLAGLPRADVAARFGSLGRAAHRLASGLEARPPIARQPAPDLAVEHTFDTPVATSGSVAFVAKHLADGLVDGLQARGLACSQLLVTACSDNDEVHERLWRHEPAFQSATIAERVRWQLDGWASGQRAPTAGITRLRIAPTEVVPSTGVQIGFWGGRSQAEDRAVRGVARLIGHLGPESVLVPERRGGRHPGSTFTLVPAASADLADRSLAVNVPPGSGPWPGVLPPPSPATVWSRQITVQVLDVAGEVVSVSGRGFVSAPPEKFLREGHLPRRVVAWGGPWPVEEHWWDLQRHRRCARFHILLDSGEAHLVVVERHEWRLEATYD